MSWQDILKVDINAQGGFRGIKMTLTKLSEDSNYEFIIRNWPNSTHLNFAPPKTHYLANKESVSSVFEELLEELP